MIAADGTAVYPWGHGETLTAAALNAAIAQSSGASFGSAPPSTPAIGTLWYNSSTGLLLVWGGAAWQSLSYLLTSGGTLTGPLFLSGDPAVPTGAATKSYVDLRTTAQAYMGGWNASTNTPAMASGGLVNGVLASSGQFWIVTVAATTAPIDGITTWLAGDYIVSNGSIWQRVQASSSPYLPLVGGSLSGTLALTGSGTLLTGTNGVLLTSNFQGSGFPAYYNTNRMIFARQTTAPGDYCDFQFQRTTSFTGGSQATLTALARFIGTYGANDACNNWNIVSQAQTNGVSGGLTVGAFLTAQRNASATDGIFGGILNATDLTGLPSASGAQVIGAEIDCQVQDRDTKTNTAMFGGTGVRVGLDIVAVRNGTATSPPTEVATGLWFTTAPKAGGGATDAYTNFRSAIGFGVNTQAYQALDTRGAIVPPGYTDPFAAVRMSSGQVVDFNGGTSQSSNAGNYLQYTTTGPSRLRYMVGSTEAISVVDTGATMLPRINTDQSGNQLQIPCAATDGQANNWLWGRMRQSATITAADPLADGQSAANKLLVTDAASVGGPLNHSGLFTALYATGWNVSTNTTYRAAAHSRIVVQGQYGVTPTLGTQFTNIAFTSNLSTGYATVSQGGLGGWSPGLGPDQGYFRGSLFGGNDNVWLTSNATNYFLLIGREIDVSIQGSASTFGRVGLLVNSFPSQRQAQGDVDCAVLVCSQTNDANNFKNGIQFGMNWGYCAISGALLKTSSRTISGSTQFTVPTGIDFYDAVFTVTPIRLPLMTNAANDAAAASAGIPLGGFYRSGSTVMQRVA